MNVDPKELEGPPDPPGEAPLAAPAPVRTAFANPVAGLLAGLVFLWLSSESATALVEAVRRFQVWAALPDVSASVGTAKLTYTREFLGRAALVWMFALSYLCASVVGWLRGGPSWRTAGTVLLAIGGLPMLVAGLSAMARLEADAFLLVEVAAASVTLCSILLLLGRSGAAVPLRNTLNLIPLVVIITASSLGATGSSVDDMLRTRGDALRPPVPPATASPGVLFVIGLFAPALGPLVPTPGDGSRDRRHRAPGDREPGKSSTS